MAKPFLNKKINYEIGNFHVPLTYQKLEEDNNMHQRKMTNSKVKSTDNTTRKRYSLSKNKGDYMLTSITKKILKQLNLMLIKNNGTYEAIRDWRNYQDDANTWPHFTLKPLPPLPGAPEPTKFIIQNGSDSLTETVYYSQLTLLKMCKQYSFKTVLDIGSHEQRISRIFRYLGKIVTCVEAAPGYEADYKGDYLDTSFPEKFDAIWCSQTYEHQRNPGLFLDKIFDDLKEGGILALTIPWHITHSICFGHVNSTSPLMLIYHLVNAGFDCSEISLKLYNSNIGIILRKKYNGIVRHLPFGSLPLGKHMGQKLLTLLGNEIFPGMRKSFPVEIGDGWAHQKITSINWGGHL